MDKLKISALVVSLNEAHLLDDCLRSIQWCDEIIVVNLESSDSTVAIAKKYTSNVINHKRVELVEELFPYLIPTLKNDWVMLIDPDERIDHALYISLFRFFENMPLDCGRINVPILYYYKNRPLIGTVWGGWSKTGRLLLKKSACNISKNVHTAIILKEGFLTYKIKREGKNVDHHYWMQSYKQMLEKHKRYTIMEGKSKYDLGHRFSYRKLFYETISAFRECFFTYKGYLDGFLGLFLSCFYSWYIWSSWISLRNYEQQQSRNNS